MLEPGGRGGRVLAAGVELRAALRRQPRALPALLPLGLVRHGAPQARLPPLPRPPGGARRRLPRHGVAGGRVDAAADAAGAHRRLRAVALPAAARRALPRAHRLPRRLGHRLALPQDVPAVPALLPLARQRRPPLTRSGR